MKIKEILFIACWVLLIVPVWGQIVQPQRYEIELEPYDNYFQVIPASEEGLILVRETKERNRNGDHQWQMVKLDTALNEEWVDTFYVDYKFYFTGYDYHNEKIYLLFNNGPYAKDDLTLFEFALPDRKPKILTIEKTFPINLTEFEMVGGSAIFGGYVNYRPTVFLYDLPQEKLIVLPGFYMDRSELIQVEVDDEKEIFRVLITTRTFDKRNTIAIKTFDQKGELLINRTIKPDNDYNLLYGQSSTLTNGQQFIAGTYSQIKTARRGKESYSRGIFIAKLDVNGEQHVTYYNYADLENFFNYMKARRQERVKKRIERRRIKGKKIRFNYRLLVHDILERKDGTYVMLGEAYYTTYSNRSDRLGWGSFHYASPFYFQNVFAGYRYTHAVVIGFDSKGKLLWDNSFEINDVISFNLEKFVNVDQQRDKLVLLYIYENVIRSKIIKGDEVLEGKSFDDIALKFENEVADDNDSEVGGLNQWYDDYFYAYGVQDIKRISESNSRKREVFYVNKIRYK
ncbi:MAG: hypothetical protein ACNS62_16320 [Candidatus Cyclobacteriaceae bacterium M3_2C_046]